MSKIITLKRGLDLKLIGGLESDCGITTVNSKTVAIVPDDFPGFVPKLMVRAGDTVAKGAPLMHDKNDETVVLVSPVGGTVKEIVRGERRKILRVVVENSANGSAPSPDSRPGQSADEIKSALMKSGLWAMMRQRPYDIVPRASSVPVNIFVTAFDSAPLAASLESQVKGHEHEIEAGLKALAKLTVGTVYVGVREDQDINVASPAKKVVFNGPHPSGLPGIQAAAIAPVNKGQTIWTLDIVTVARIGALMLSGKTFWTTTVALTGSEVEHPRLIQTNVGSELKPLLAGLLKNDARHKRIISGNVLTGAKESEEGYLRFPYRQITVIPEGDDVDEFMGWASLSPQKMSESRSFTSKLFGKRLFAPDARLQGGRRAMIMSGMYDNVIPMDIMPEYLIKAILSRDIDKMEALGIYEIAPEDFALAEYVDPSKLELQKIVRDGLDYLRKEVE